jgi:uncharacterized protein
MLGIGLGFALLAPVAYAQRVEGDRAAASGIYEAEVAVNNQTDTERNNGFARGLAQVLAKISGDRSATGRPGVGQELRRAKDYVSGYDYRQDQGVSSNGAPSFKTVLVVRFDRAEVDGIIGALGLPIWPQPRPKPVLWLGIDDGKGPRLVAVSQSNAARAVLDRPNGATAWVCPRATPPSRRSSARSGVAIPAPSPGCPPSTARRCS